MYRSVINIKGSLQHRGLITSADIIISLHVSLSSAQNTNIDMLSSEGQIPGGRDTSVVTPD